MNWFDTTNLTSIAKTALREAQKTIDRALDIKEAGNAGEKITDSEEDGASPATTVLDNPFAVTTLQPVKSLLSSPVGTVLWGSIRGIPPDDEEMPKSADPAPPTKPSTVSSQPSPVQVVSKPPSLETKTSPKPDWGWGWESQLQTSVLQPPEKSVAEWSDVKLDEENEKVEGAESRKNNTEKPEFSLELKTTERLGNEIDTPCSILTLGSEVSSPDSPSVELIGSRTLSQSEVCDSSDHRELSVLSSNSSSLTVISPETEPVCAVADCKEDEVQIAAVRTLSPNAEIFQESRSMVGGDSRTVSSTDSFVKCEDPSKEGETELRDSSPLSFERSEATKHRSAFNSGHTSGDELETAASSDIEVISSPGSRPTMSPNRYLADHGLHDGPTHLTVMSSHPKAKGHRRQLSEGSSGGSDDSLASEVEKLMKRISEKNRILEARETKLLELSRINANLQEENLRITSKLQESEKSHRTENESAARLLEDLTRRLSQMEQKCQQAVSDKESLICKVESLNQDLSSRVAGSEVDALLAEKDELIAELRVEGDKLSKQHLQHSSAIKKLRAKEKDDEKVLKIQKEKLEELQKETDRLKKSLSAKEDIERSQIDAVRQLTEANKTAEKDLTALRTRCAEAESQVSSLRDAVEFTQSFRAFFRELERLEHRNVELESETAKITLSKEMSVRQELQLALENSQKTALEEKSMLFARVQDLTSSLEEVEAQLKRRTEQHRAEVSNLMERLSDLEASQEDSSRSITEATRPLLRQIESLHQSVSTVRERAERTEKALLEKQRILEGDFSSKVQNEKRMIVEVEQLRADVERLASELRLVTEERARLELNLGEERRKTERGTVAVEVSRKLIVDELEQLRTQFTSLSEALEAEKLALEEERDKSKALQEQLSDREKTITTLLSHGHTVYRPTELYHSTSFHSRTSSPTPSLGRISMSEDSQEAHTKDPWGNEDDIFESGMATPVARQTSVYDIAKSGFGAATLLETLEAQLKLKEGEIVQLQFELANQERKRSALANEIVRLSTENENLHERLQRIERLRPEFDELQVKYDALLTMYGEKVEEAEELRMDLLDVKEAYKAQIDHLTKLS